MDEIELERARHFFGYGRWDAPFWFIGPEVGKGRDEPEDNTRRVDVWLQSRRGELCDCRQFHSLLGEEDWHQQRPRLQPTWRPLMLLLATFLSESSGKEDLRAYQRDRWGSQQGETCLIELSGLAARSMRVNVERQRFREERIDTIRKRIFENRPVFVVMYGNEKKYWEQIAGGELTLDQPVKYGSVLFAFAPHPAKRRRKNEDWIGLGRKLRSEAGYSKTSELGKAGKPFF
ncbi:MAG TPA: hypothetical protein VK593_06395 [Edaphobacter sp.]|nr:hypothetical protein [Edaphobacter sp.]